MTMTAPLFKPIRSEDRPKRIRQAKWADADLGFWVGNLDGVYVGSVEQLGGSYCARDTFGTDRGCFASLAEAQSHLEEHLAQSRVQARLGGNVEQPPTLIRKAGPCR